MLTSGPDEPECRGVEERGRTAHPEDDLVAVGQGQQICGPRAHAADQIFDRCLTMGGAYQRGTCRGQRIECFNAHLRRSRSESTVGGQELCGNLHGYSLAGSAMSTESRSSHLVA